MAPPQSPLLHVLRPMVEWLACLTPPPPPPPPLAYGGVVSMFDFHRSDRGSICGRGSKMFTTTL